MTTLASVAGFRHVLSYSLWDLSRCAQLLIKTRYDFSESSPAVWRSIRNDRIESIRMQEYENGNVWGFHGVDGNKGLNRVNASGIWNILVALTQEVYAKRRWKGGAASLDANLSRYATSTFTARQIAAIPTEVRCFPWSFFFLFKPTAVWH